MPMSFERTYYRSEAYKDRREELDADIEYKREILVRIGQVSMVMARSGR